MNGQQIQLISSRPRPTQLNQIQIGFFEVRHDVEIQKSCHPPSFQSLNPGRVCRQPGSSSSTTQLVRIHAVCTKYRYWLRECREGLHHQTSTNPPPTTKANATLGGPTPSIEARHLQFISTLVLPGCPVLVCRRPCVSPGPHHQLTDELPHLSTDTRPPPGHLLCSPPVSFNSSRPLVPIPHSLAGPLEQFCLCVSPPHPLNPNASWLAPAFAASACAASLHMLLVRDCLSTLSTAGLLRDSTKPLGLDWLGP